VVQRLRQTYPATNRVMGATMTSLQDFLGRDVRKPLATLIAAVGILLLIACANIGNLLLVHAEARRRESALRIALGAGRRRLVRQALSHSAMLSLLGGALGIAVAWGGMRLLVALRPPRLQIGTLAIDIRVVGFLFAITALSGLIFGIGPALWIGSRAPQEALKESSRGESRSRRMRLWGDGLVVAEVGMALLLGVGASLLIRSFVRLAEVDPGFDPTGVLAVSLDLPTARYDSASKVLQFYRTAEERLRALPGVTGTGLVSYPPLTNSSWSSEFAVAGRPQNGPGNDVLHREISPDYPQVMRIPLLRGRALALSDGPDAPAVVLINDVIARRYFPSEDPIGKRVAFDRIPDSTSQWYTIVGVVGSERQGGPEQEPRPEFLAPFAQAVRSAMTVMVRSKTDPAALIPAVRRTIALTDPDLAISGVQPMTTIRNESVARQRFLMTLLFAFAACGLALCAVGVYGVAAHTARGRQREMGIRIALGARSSGVRWLVVGHTLRLAAAGVAIGIGAALVLTRLMESLLFDVTAGDPATYLLVPAVLFSTAFLATWLPAARASRADPMESLRTE
jgi:putative ABC transport system permease protein